MVTFTFASSLCCQLWGSFKQITLRCTHIHCRFKIEEIVHYCGVTELNLITCTLVTHALRLLKLLKVHAR